VDAGNGERTVEHTARRTDERMSLNVFRIAWLFADDHDAGIARTFAEYRLRRVLVQLARGAVARLRACSVEIQRDLDGGSGSAACHGLRALVFSESSGSASDSLLFHRAKVGLTFGPPP